MKYRKKPIIIDAIKYDGTLESIVPLGMPEVCQDFISDDLIIPTLEGDMKANKGDYIIKGIKGEFYPCKPDIFEACYEKVD